MLIENRLDGKVDKVKTAIGRIKMFEANALAMHENGFYVAYSGGKDSAVIAELCREAGVKFELVYNHTTVDPPELVYHLRSEFKRYGKLGIKCSVNMPKETMWQLIVRKRSPPTRLIRYCCEILKEGGGKDRFVITGVRWAESVARKARSGMFHPNIKIDGKWVYTSDNDEAKTMLKQCTSHHKVVLNPIIDWLDEDVWEYIKSRNLPYCKLYDEGYTRLGCIGCPMNTVTTKQDFERWPEYKRAYLRAFDRMLKENEYTSENKTWETADDVMEWWLTKKPKNRPSPGQIPIDYKDGGNQ